MRPTIEELNKEAGNTIYTPLEPGKIRLVHLHPASDSKADVVCSLEYARLSDKPRYQALSYVWGSQKEPKEILLNGTTVLITQNLDKVLRRLRLQHEPRVIWADALAINQSDVDERNAEVQVMRDIYSSAYETLAWFDKDLGENQDYFLSHMADPGYDILKEFRKLNISVIKNTLSAIARQSYWTRVWTAQEVRYSEQVTLVTTRYEVPFDSLLRLKDAASALERSGGIDLIGMFDIDLRGFQRKCLSVRPLGPSDVGHLDLSSWIDICCLRKCSNPRDFVFGLWTLLPPQVKNRVKVDYSLPTEQVLRSCKKAFLDTGSKLDFLGLSNLFGYTEDAILPSWDPELYFKGPYKGVWELRCLPEILRLDHDRRWSQTDLASVSEDMRTLHVKGTHIGMINVAATKMTDPLLLFNEAYAHRLSTRHTSRPTISSLIDSTCATMRSLQVKVDEAEEFSFAVKPLYTYSGIHTNLKEDLTKVARYISNSEEATTGVDDFIEIQNRYYGYRYIGLNQNYFSVARLEVDESIATDGGKARALFGLMWHKFAEPGDQAYLVHGCSRPLLLRPANGDLGRYKLVGAIFLPGPEGRENPLIDELMTRPDSPVSDIFIC